jgi:anti-sigma regulatory factor (Ser/Thr protein kinase)
VESREHVAVSRLARQALGTTEPEQLFADALGLVAGTLGVSHCALFELRMDGTLRLRAGLGWRDDTVGSWVEPGGASSQASYTLQYGGAVVATDYAAEKRFAVSPLAREHGLAAGVSVPIPGPARPFGVLAAYAPTPRAFGGGDVALLDVVAGVLASAGRERDQTVAGLAAAERQTRRIAKLVASLLDVSRITAGRLDLEVEEVDLATVVQEVLSRHEEELQAAGCALTVRCAGPAVGTWDRLRLDQVVTNLVSNAVKYGAGRPVEVLVRADDHTATLMVRDHGIGIPPEHQKRIFDRFERVVSGRHYGGFGLGLWIVRQIVEAFGGSIDVASQPGEGSTFTVQFPRTYTPVHVGRLFLRPPAS